MIPVNDIRFVYDVQERDDLAVLGWVELPANLEYWIMVHPVEEHKKPERKRSVHEAQK